MHRIAGTLLVLAAFIGMAQRSEAIPVLQLDLIAGRYDPVTETVVAPGGVFELVAILTPGEGATAEDIQALLQEGYFISVALTPAVPEPGGDLGSFEFEGISYNATSGLNYGNPPVEYIHQITQPKDAGDVPPHGIFPTYFAEIGFSFNPLNAALVYNTQDDPGGLTPSADGSAYYASFVGNSRLLSSTYNLHFDLYDQTLARCARTQTCEDIDINRFAPFSHDAQTITQVPEPSSAVLLLVAATFAAGCRWRFRRDVSAIR